MLSKKISEWIADAGRWLWQAYLLMILITLVVASVIVVITGITWSVIKLLAMLP